MLYWLFSAYGNWEIDGTVQSISRSKRAQSRSLPIKLMVVCNNNSNGRCSGTLSDFDLHHFHLSQTGDWSSGLILQGINIDNQLEQLREQSEWRWKICLSKMTILNIFTFTSGVIEAGAISGTGQQIIKTRNTTSKTTQHRHNDP